MSGDNFQHILDSLPPKLPRSRLEPYGRLIDKLRSRGRTYREVVDILAAKCGLRVSVSTLHDFVHVHLIPKGKQKEPEPADPNRGNRVIPTRAVNLDQRSPTPDEIQERISGLRRRSTLVEPTPGSFDYDPDEPLRLPSNPEKNKS